VVQRFPDAVCLEGLPMSKFNGSKIDPIVSAEFKSRGLSDEDGIAMRATRSCLYGRPSIRLPYSTLDGKDSGFGRHRLLDGLTPKYLQESGTGVHVYYSSAPAARCRADWSAIAADPSIAVAIVESEIKSYVVTKEFMPAIGLGGVNSYGSKKMGELLLKDLRQFKWVGRKVLIIYDADCATNPAVDWARGDLALKISELGATPLTVQIPFDADGISLGADDYILKHGVLSFSKLEQMPFARVEQLHRINRDCAFIRNPVGVYREEVGKIISIPDFLAIENKNKAVVPNAKGGLTTVKAGTEWRDWGGRREYRALTYAPGAEPVTADGCLNSWSGWGCESVAGDVSPFSWLLERLIPDLVMRSWVVLWLAHMIQRPCEKVMSALVFYGPQKTGKSLLTEILELVVGSSNCQTIGNQELGGTFTEWASGKLLIIAEEVSGLDPRHDGNRLKGFITLPHLTINAKYLRPYTLPNLARFIFCSNMLVPVFLDKDDRRYAACRTLRENTIPSERGVTLKRWAAKEGGAAAIRHYLESIDLAAFDPTANPPWTSDKTKLVGDSRTALVAFAYDLMADDERPGVALMVEFMHAAACELQAMPSLKAMANALEDAGAIPLPRVRVRHGDHKRTVYSLKGPLADTRESAVRAKLNSEANRREKFFNFQVTIADPSSKFTRPPTTDHFAEDDLEHLLSEGMRV
jgi:hypothetical protein